MKQVKLPKSVKLCVMCKMEIQPPYLPKRKLCNPCQKRNQRLHEKLSRMRKKDKRCKICGALKEYHGKELWDAHKMMHKANKKALKAMISLTREWRMKK